MAQTPNRHIICYTARDVSPNQYRGGRTWQGQDDPSQAIAGTLENAETVLAGRIASDAAPVAPGMFRVTEFTNHYLHSWHEDETPVEVAFNVDPLGRALRATGGRW